MHFFKPTRRDQKIAEIEHELKEIRREIRHIIFRLNHPGIRARSATLTIGENMANVTVHINDIPKTAVFTEFSGPNGTGIKVPPSGTITFTSDNTGVVTVDPTGQLAYIAPGTATISGTDQGTTPALTASGTVTVMDAAAQSAVLEFVDPPAKS